MKVTDLLTHLRSTGQLTERKLGVFYRKGKPFLHFHEDPTGIYADLRHDGGWERLAVNSSAEKQRLCRRIAEIAQ
jgi:hypothetical protein